MANTLEFKIHQAVKHQSGLTPIQDLANGLFSASIAKTIFYPFDVAQILMQTNAEDSREGILQTLAHMYEKYGIWSWFRGNIASCSIGSTLAIGSFLGASPLLRDIGYSPLSRFLISASLTTAVYPLQVAKVRMITHPKKYTATLETIQMIYKEEELQALYRGLSFTLLGIILNGLATVAALRIIGSIWKKPRDKMSFWEDMLFGALGVVIAEAIQYPIDTAVKIVQSQANDPDNVLRTLLNTGRIPRTSGFRSLFSGFAATFIKPFAIPLQWKIADFTRQLVFSGKHLL
jgi:hypothetical protein